MSVNYFPPASFHFVVDLGGSETPFQEVSGLDVELEIEDVSEGGVNDFKHRLPVRTRYNNLVLKRGLAEKSSDLITWVKENILSASNLNKPVETRDITVTLKDASGNNDLMTWAFVRAYPVKWSVSNFNAQENALAIETIEFAYQRYELK